MWEPACHPEPLRNGGAYGARSYPHAHSNARVHPGAHPHADPDRNAASALYGSAHAVANLALARHGRTHPAAGHRAHHRPRAAALGIIVLVLPGEARWPTDRSLHLPRLVLDVPNREAWERPSDAT
jgi:hypothetical protein